MIRHERILPRQDALRSFLLSKKLRWLSGCDFADGPDKQFRFLFGVVRRESDPDPAADPVYAHPVGERFRVIIPIGGKDAVGVGYAPASMEAPRPESGVRVQMMGIIL